MTKAQNHGAVWYRCIPEAAVLCLALAFTLSPAFAASNRVEELDQIFFDANYENPSEECIIQILREEQQSGHPFTKEEVLEAAQKFLQERGMTLVTRRRHCFTCEMRVLTPSGYVPIERLSNGDAVYSWDEKKKTLVLNQISQLFISHLQTYGELSGTPTGRPLEVTPDHPFLVADTGKYVELKRIGSQDNLVVIEPKHCAPLLQPRGIYRHKGKGTVRSISVKGEPHNFVVEGFVVHNKPIF